MKMSVLCRIVNAIYLFPRDHHVIPTAKPNRLKAYGQTLGLFCFVFLFVCSTQVFDFAHLCASRLGR